jgi:diguanylate cyclase (GGDEF)-like protein
VLSNRSSHLVDCDSLLRNLKNRIDRQKEEPRSYALFIVGIDSFHRVSDSLGHRLANDILDEIGRRLNDTLRNTEDSFVCHLVGDEFALLVGDLGSAEDAVMYAGLIGFLLTQPMNCGRHKVRIVANVGVSFGGASRYHSAPQMLERAEVALHHAQSAGIGQCSLFSQKMRAEALARLRLESDLRIALQERQFQLYYQPKIWLDTGRVKGFEALIRWRHPEMGMISPQVFIPIAEEIGLISEIGRWVARQAIQQLAAWRNAGIVDSKATMAINVSTQQFYGSDLLEFLIRELRALDLPPRCLAVEITESLIVEDAPCALALLENLVDIGIGLDLDDFGTGYSSLSYLHRFPFRSIKIDQSFIRQMCTDPKSMQLVAAIIGLARSLEMGVIAEGVETEMQLDKLREMGCAAAQGYLFSPPLSPLDLEPFLRSHLQLPTMSGNTQIFSLPGPDSRSTRNFSGCDEDASAVR